jgi:hypothetical protein
MNAFCFPDMNSIYDIMTFDVGIITSMGAQKLALNI